MLYEVITIYGLKFRARATKFGDIVDSSPIFLGDPAFNYPDTLESQPYTSFKSSVSRPAMMYVGANDGMLHGFDATTGEEKIVITSYSIHYTKLYERFMRC